MEGFPFSSFHPAPLTSSSTTEATVCSSPPPFHRADFPARLRFGSVQFRRATKVLVAGFVAVSPLLQPFRSCPSFSKLALSPKQNPMNWSSVALSLRVSPHPPHVSW